MTSASDSEDLAACLPAELRAGARFACAGDETLEATLDLGGFYRQMMAGGLNLSAAQGQWCFGLALVKELYAP